MAARASANSLTRESAETKTTIIDGTNMKWDVLTKTILDEDTGIQSLRVTHELTANILSTDVVQFELAYIPWSQWLSGTNIAGKPTGIDNTSASNLGEDAARCSLSINASNKMFWQATVSDAWYKCDLPSTNPPTGGWGSLTDPNKCAHASNTWASDAANIESSSTNNWAAPLLDADPDDPWCTQANTETTYSPYQCKKIKCIMQRSLDTGDDVYDYQFDFANGQSTNPVKVDEDAMIIQLGRARVWINADSFSTGMAGPAKADTTT